MYVCIDQVWIAPFSNECQATRNESWGGVFWWDLRERGGGGDGSGMRMSFICHPTNRIS